jgi:hypothetical protein
VSQIQRGTALFARTITNLNVLEALFVIIGLVGVGAIFWPAALILLAILGVWSCEKASQRRGIAAYRNGERKLRQVA